MLLSDIESLLRLDLFDPSNASSPRWTVADLDRAIDKAVDRYSQYYPNVVYVDMNTQPYQRTYAYPPSWNANYPVWWLERIIYPLQAYGSQFAAPSAAPTVAASTGTGLNVGAYQYAVTFLSQGGETPPSPVATVTTTNNNQKVLLSAMPLGATTTTLPGTATNMVIGRDLYRSLVGGTTLYLLATLQDNVTTSYIDTTPDSALTSRPPAPTVNTSGVMLWPPYEREFAEYSNLFDSTAALAAGGNLGTLGTVGVGNTPTGSATPAFTLKLSSVELPQDSTQVMRVFYATKHQLDAIGSTIPEVHRDIIVLGASAFAMEAYQVPTNDNFDFQDGALHDRVDDTKIPQAWLSATRARMQQFERWLQEVKLQRDFAYGARVHWGDIPTRWPRL